MITPEDDWLTRVSEECRKAILCFARFNHDEMITCLSNLRELFEEEVELTNTTWHVHNFMASIAMSTIDVFRGREMLRNSAIERLTEIRRLIANDKPHLSARAPVPAAAAE